MEIKGFKDEFHFLSNFYYSTFAWKGKVWKTAEHAYQAAKSIDPNEWELIWSLKKPSEAKRVGYKVNCRSDWDDVKVSIMKEIVKQKFLQNTDLKEKLLATEDAYLEETNNHKDIFWGVCNGIGENNLGRVLMDLRREFKAGLA